MLLRSTLWANLGYMKTFKDKIATLVIWRPFRIFENYLSANRDQRPYIENLTLMTFQIHSLMRVMAHNDHIYSKPLQLDLIPLLVNCLLKKQYDLIGASWAMVKFISIWYIFIFVIYFVHIINITTKYVFIWSSWVTLRNARAHAMQRNIIFDSI